MRKRWTGIVLSSVLGISGGLALAQEQPSTTPPPADGPVQAGHARRTADPNERVQQMAKRLKLTPDQQNQVLGILTAQREQVSGLRSDASLSREDRRAKMQAIRTDSDNKIRSVLTDDQKQTFDAMQQRRMAKQQNHKG